LLSSSDFKLSTNPSMILFPFKYISFGTSSIT
jgi:hypothetical protein